MLTKEKNAQMIAILKEELVPAMGCTEPISIAYAAAKARETLVEMPIRGRLEVSGNIVKNAKSVVVPHTGGMRGIKSAFAAGLAVGDADARLEVLSNVTAEDKEKIEQIRDEFPLEIVTPEDARIFDIGVTLISQNHTVFVRIADSHTNVVCIRKDGEIIFEKELADEGKKTDRSILNVEDIISFAKTVEIEALKEVLDRQIQYNMV